jgi:hypothetical protein
LRNWMSQVRILSSPPNFKLSIDMTLNNMPPRCWICDKHIAEPLYWIDPKFYPQFDEIKYLCDPICAHKAKEKIDGKA